MTLRMTIWMTLRMTLIMMTFSIQYDNMNDIQDDNDDDVQDDSPDPTHHVPGLGPIISTLVSDPRPREAEGWASSRGSIWGGRRPPSRLSTGRPPAFSHLQSANKDFSMKLRRPRA